MHSITDARALLSQLAPKITQSEWVPVIHGLNRYAAKEVPAQIDHPPQSNSAMDGYALAIHDVNQIRTLPISQTIAAGDKPPPLTPGTVARIFTGAVVPEGADTVVIQEHCDAHNCSITIHPLVEVSAGDNIRPRGQDFFSEDILVKAGQRVSPAHAALLTAGGCQGFYALRCPRIALLSTGSELVDPGHTLLPGQIYNSNQPMLNQLLSRWGCQVIAEHKVVDRLDKTKELLLSCAEQADLIISSGGVSVGEADFVKQAIAETGHLELWKIDIKPGKPLAFGQVGPTPVLALPGNPVSAFVSALLFVKPFIDAMLGASHTKLQPYFAPANFAIAKPRQRPEFVRGRYQDGQLEFYKNQSSGVISSLAWANVLVFIDKNTQIQPGDLVPFFSINDFY